ncbi:hypothetical protein DYB36_014387, partial [Aphanomyces astaci]
DTSGAWTSRGLFGALSRRSLSVEEAYGCMRPNQDLKLGQAHCIPIDSDTFVCLLVVQSYLHQRQKRTHKTLSLRLNALQVALKAVAAHARRLDATIHMPRLGAGTPGFNWYAVERLIRKHLTDGATTFNEYDDEHSAGTCRHIADMGIDVTMLSLAHRV